MFAGKDFGLGWHGLACRQVQVPFYLLFIARGRHLQQTSFLMITVVSSAAVLCLKL